MTVSTADHFGGFAELADGGVIAYQIHGLAHAGVPALLIRPLGGSMALWGRFRAHLAETVRVVSFDLRGTGDSSRGPARASTRAIARDALVVLDHIGIARAHVFGISLGGMTATWLAVLAPTRVAKLCIASAPARGLELSRTGLAHTLALAACFFRRGEDVEVRLVDRILSRGFCETHPDDVHRIEHLVRAKPSSRRALLDHALAGVRHNATRELRFVRAPTLVLAGRNDDLLGAEPVRALARGIPSAQFEIVDDSGHDLTLERPTTTAVRISEFFSA